MATYDDDRRLAAAPRGVGRLGPQARAHACGAGHPWQSRASVSQRSRRRDERQGLDGRDGRSGAARRGACAPGSTRRRIWSTSRSASGPAAARSRTTRSSPWSPSCGPASSRAGIALTHFEFSTLLALEWFARIGVELAVVEVGLGGRLDATNTVRPVVTAITSIAHDHEEWLGRRAAPDRVREGRDREARCSAGGRPGPGGGRRRHRRARGRRRVAAVVRAGRDGWLEESDGGLVFRRADGVAVRDGLALGLGGAFQRRNAEVALLLLAQLGGPFTVERHGGAGRPGGRPVARPARGAPGGAAGRRRRRAQPGRGGRPGGRASRPRRRAPAGGGVRRHGGQGVAGDARVAPAARERGDRHARGPARARSRRHRRRDGWQRAGARRGRSARRGATRARARRSPAMPWSSPGRSSSSARRTRRSRRPRRCSSPGTAGVSDAREPPR